MEEITPRDETSSICTHGARALPSGGLSMDGPPTTLSGIGVDRMAFAQANVTRDNTKFLNGAIVGERDVFQVSMSFFQLNVRFVFLHACVLEVDEVVVSLVL